jgi:exopolysaccharide biosynthesis WecB/TagA/CpsF family protein
MGHGKKLAGLVRHIRIVNSANDKRALASDILASQSAVTLAFVNAHAINLCWSSQDVFSAFMDADVVLRDGKGLEILFQKAGNDSGLNMNGTDFIPELLAVAQGKSIAVLGTQDPWLTAACLRLQHDGHRVVAKMDGFQPVEDYVAVIRDVQPDIVLLAQGMPRQEQVASLLKATFPDRPMLIICGGAIIDFLAGRFSRAPFWMRRAGLEWAYRFMCEPMRLFRRYVIGNAVFLVRMQRITDEIISE